MYQPYQPYRQRPDRPQTQALLAMLQGRPQYLPNPMDQWRALQHQGALLRLLQQRR
jgi:hypothetical protein